MNEWGTTGDGNGMFDDPAGIEVDGAGNVYVVDRNNHRIQVFTAEGNWIGQWGETGAPGGGTDHFNTPTGIAIDGNRAYIADRSNHRVVVWNLNGNYVGERGSWGSNLGQFINPYDVAVDSLGNVFVVDRGNDRVQILDENVMNPVAMPNGLVPADAALDGPRRIEIAPDGTAYVLDSGNARIQVYEPS